MVSRLHGQEPSSPWSDPARLLYREVQNRVSPQDFDTWFAQTPCRFEPPGHFVFTAPNNFRRAWIEKHFRELLQSCARCVFESDVGLRFEVGSRDPLEPGAPPLAPPGSSPARTPEEPSPHAPWGTRSPATVPPQRSSRPQAPETQQRSADGFEERFPASPGEGRSPLGIPAEPAARPASRDRSPAPSTARGSASRASDLNPEYTFENFVVGPSNRVAHAAAIAVSELPAKTYNPLFIHGQPGVGKTHLIHAMAHRIQASSRLRVGYISSVDLVQPDLPSQAGSADGFRSQCRSLDVLILDDLQFLSTKERGQLELFHAINEFLDSQKQIIFASRSHPRDTAGIQERLASRLQWGLVACVEPPGFETRVSILLRKAHLRQREIPLEVAEFIANHLRDSVRELEGALLRIFSLAEFRGCSVDLEVARAALHDLLTEERHAGTITIATILRIVQDYYGVKPKDFLSRSKVRSLTLARHVGMYLARHLTQLSLQEIGMHFGGRDHTTVLYAEDRIARMRSTHPQIRADLQVLKNRILSPPLY